MSDYDVTVSGSESQEKAEGVMTRTTDTIKVRCKTCGEEFSPLAHNLRAGNGKYCSRSCVSIKLSELKKAAALKRQQESVRVSDGVVQIPVSGGHVVLVDEADYELLKKYVWVAHRPKNRRTLYAVSNNSVRVDGRRKSAAIRMHRLIIGDSYGLIDHANGNDLDNRRCNLRPATESQNQANRRKAKGKSSIYKGVCWSKNEKKWIASIFANRKGRRLNLFKDEREAALAYDKAAREAWGEYAKTNFPKDEDL
jgi:hypothetical protein